MKQLLSNIVGSVAPKLATTLGGPLAGMAVGAIADALGCEPSRDAVEQRLQNPTPDDLLKLKKAEQDYAVRMKELEIDENRLAFEDTQDARAKFSKDWTARSIGLLTICSFIGYIMLVTIQPPEANDAALVNLVLGYLGGLATSVIAFYFGGSKQDQSDH